jgi:hypothetical protein
MQAGRMGVGASGRTQLARDLRQRSKAAKIQILGGFAILRGPPSGTEPGTMDCRSEICLFFVHLRFFCDNPRLISYLGYAAQE